MENNLDDSIKETVFSSKKFIFLIVAILFALYVFSGIYSVSQNEVAVLQRFGKVVDDRVMPGIHIAFPWPVDKVSKVPIKTMNRISIDDFVQYSNYDSNAYKFYEFTGLSPYCITGDNNIVNINCGLQYSISDPVKYLFYTSNPDRILHEFASNIIIQCLSTYPVDKVLTYGKREIEVFIKTNLQKKLDDIECGVNISFVELKEVTPPGNVQDYFNDVINSKIDKNKLISKAESYSNEKLPEANAVANRMLEEAQAYKNEVIAKSEGDTSRFLDNMKVYKQSKKITKKRIYLEFVKDILSGVDDKYIVSADNKNVPAKLKIFKDGNR